MNDNIESGGAPKVEEAEDTAADFAEIPFECSCGSVVPWRIGWDEYPPDCPKCGRSIADETAAADRGGVA
jgi:hypothetical protein